ncbi:ATP-binding protein [Arachnia propionica]|uniref:Rad50/SbcC-type AAA domain-containing protein n=1 Tax=Arachnia propionica TaxID=1750 RepID=A0A3P1WV14_9ACTN|nr:AAA family ATPase [Arachnia propionica]RRD50432.1 hypothetical protein EII35_04580 [Arachnia propionica]
MRLRRITLRNYRGTRERTVDFPDGITIVQGPNEAGKSSLMEGLRLLRAYKSSSNAAPIRRVKPVDRDEGPEVEVEMTLGPHTVVHTKRWLRVPRTTLEVRGPHPESLTGDEAHDRFLELFDEHVDGQLFSALEMTQGDSLTQGRLVELPSLRRALDDASLPVADHDTLLAAVEREYQRYFTATGRPTGEYQKGAQELARLQEEVERARSVHDEVERLSAEHERNRGERRDVATRFDEAGEELAEIARSDERLAGLRTRLAEHEDLAARASADLERGEHADQERRELISTVSGWEDELAAAEEALEERRGRRAEAEAGTGAALAARDAAEGRLAGITQRLRDLDEVERRRSQAEELTHLTERLARIEQAEEAVAAAAAAFEAGRVDGGLIQRLEQAEVECRLAESRVEAVAARVRLEVLGEVLIDDEGAPPGVREARITRPMRIEVPGQLRLELDPGMDMEDLERAHRDALDSRDALLAEIGASTVDEARRRDSRSRELGSQRDEAETELRLALGGDNAAVLRARAETIRQHLEAQETTLTPADDREALDREHEQAAADLGQARSALEEARQQERVAREQCIRDEAGVEGLRTRIAEARQRLEAARERCADQAITERIDRCRREVAAHTEQVEAVQEELRRSDAAGTRLRLDNATALVARLEKEINELDGEAVRIETLLADRMASGPYDVLARAQQELEALSARQDGRERAARAVARLRETLLRHRDQAQLRYVAPFKERIEVLGRPVLGEDLEVEISPDLAMVSRTLAGVTVPFESLSVGAREQFALLGRLACADLVDAEEGAPVMIDDALGYADPERVRAIATVLNDVGSRAQIIVLTCQPERFGHIGRATVVRI